MIRLVRDCIEQIEVSEYAEGERRETDMSLNVNPLGASERVMDSLRNIRDEDVSRYRHPGEGLKSRLKEFLNAGSKQLMLTNGCDGALEKLALTYFSRDTTVAVPVPSFHRYEIHARKMGAEVEFIESEGGIHPGPEVLGDVDAEYMLLANPQNPTGEKFSTEEIRKIKSEFEGVLIIDEALRLPFDNHSELIDEECIVTGSFSKSFGLAGLRAGYVLAEDTEHLQKTGSLFLVNSLAQVALDAVLEDREYLRKTREAVEKELTYLKEEMDSLGTFYTRSETTSMLVSLAGTSYEENVDSLIAELEERGVKVVHGGHFRSLEDNHFRISVRDHKTNRRFIAALKRVIS